MGHDPSHYNARAVRVCFVGDSFVNGTGDDACLGWVGRVGASLRAGGIDITVYNLGIRRDTSADIAARWREETSRRLPDTVEGLLVFSFGVNDTTTENGSPRVSPDKSLANLRAILSSARRSWPTLVIGPPPVADATQNARIEQLSNAFAGACTELDVPYLDTYRPLLRIAAWLGEAQSGDGAHPNAEGYSALAQLIVGWSAWQATFNASQDGSGT